MSLDRDAGRRRLALGGTQAAVLVALAGALTSVSATWWTPRWKAGWAGVGLGVLLLAAVGGLRLYAMARRTAGDRWRTLARGLAAALVGCVAAGGLAFCLSVWFHGRDLDRAARVVPVKVSHCDWSRASLYECRYEYTIAGRTHTGWDNFKTLHSPTVRVDPAHPGHLRKEPYLGPLILAVLLAILAVPMLGRWALAERDLVRAVSGRRLRAAARAEK